MTCFVPVEFDPEAEANVSGNLFANVVALHHCVKRYQFSYFSLHWLIDWLIFLFLSPGIWRTAQLRGPNWRWHVVCCATLKCPLGPSSSRISTRTRIWSRNVNCCNRIGDLRSFRRFFPTVIVSFFFLPLKLIAMSFLSLFAFIIQRIFIFFTAEQIFFFFVIHRGKEFIAFYITGEAEKILVKICLNVSATVHHQPTLRSRLSFTPLNAFTQEALHLHMRHCIYTWGTAFTQEALHSQMRHCIHTLGTAFTREALHSHIRHCIHRWGTAFTHEALHSHMRHCIYTWGTAFTH